MDIKQTVHDNFLTQADFESITKNMLGDFFPWYFHSTVASDKDKEGSHFFWTHVFFEQPKGITSDYFKILNPIMKKLNIKALIRIKANMYSNQGKIEEHEAHQDYNYKHKGALFSLNTTNGYTTFADKSKVQGAANRMVLFDPSKPHFSSTVTNTNVRVNIVFNYF